MHLSIVFGNNVKYYRYKNKLTQEKVAELVGASVTYISQLELGKHTPSFEKLEALSRVLKVEPFEFFIKREIQKLPPRVDMTNSIE